MKEALLAAFGHSTVKTLSLSLTTLRYDSMAKNLHFEYIFKVHESTKGFTDPVSVKFASRLPRIDAISLYRRFTDVYPVAYYSATVPCDPTAPPMRSGHAGLRRI